MFWTYRLYWIYPYKMSEDSRIYCCSGMRKNMKAFVSLVQPALAPVSFKISVTVNRENFFKVLTELVQKLQFDVTGKLHNKNFSCEANNLTAIDRYNKWQVLQMRKTADSNKLLNFLKIYMNLIGAPDKTNPNWASEYTYQEHNEFRTSRNNNAASNPSRLPTVRSAVAVSKQSMENLVRTSSEDKTNFSESFKTELRGLGFIIHTRMNTLFSNYVTTRNQQLSWPKKLKNFKLF